MNKLILATLPIITILALSISSPGGPALEPNATASPAPPTPPPTPTSTATPAPPTAMPEIMDPNYTSPAWGFSLWYPEHWIYDDQVRRLIVATSERLIVASEFSTGATMVVLGAELQTGQTVDQFLHMMLDELCAEDIDIGEPECCTVGRQRGIIVTFEDTPEEG